MQWKLRTTAACAALAAAIAAPPAAAQSMRTLDAGGGLYLQQVGPRALLRDPQTGARELAVVRGSQLRRLERLAGGWIAAGEIEADGASDLFLVRGGEDGPRPLAAPPNPRGHLLRSGPMPLVEDGRLVGLAWLAGSQVRKTAVYAARWTGREWSPAELVSPAGEGTQIAIDGAVLPDGSWLLVWSAFDGNDDEILWSRRVGREWTRPAPLHEPNESPDITPALVATGRGALAAWNGWDGDTYRVRLAAFDDGGWRQLPYVSPAGAVAPGLTPSRGGARLLYRTVRPPAWTVLEIDERGRVRRSALAELETTQRPGLAPEEESGAGAALEWPGEPIDAPRRVRLEWRVEP